LASSRDGRGLFARRHSLQMLRLTLIGSALALLIAAPAFGGNVVVTLALRSGSLTLRAPQLSAAAGRATQVPITVADGRGSGAGWTLQLSSKNVAISSITAHCAPGSTCTLPRSTGTPSGAAILHVAPGSGMGVMNLVVTVAPLGQNADAVPLSFSVAQASSLESASVAQAVPAVSTSSVSTSKVKRTSLPATRSAAAAAKRSSSGRGNRGLRETVRAG
jgi:hypothetical protein